MATIPADSDLLSDPLADLSTPPSKRRKLASVTVTPPRYPDLLAAFGAPKIPSSVSKMARDSDGARQLRAETRTTGFIYAESDESDIATPNGSQGSSFGEPLGTGGTKTSIDLTGSDSEEDAEREDDDVDEVIEVAPARMNGTREIPQRSSKKRVSYATPKKPKKKSIKRQKPVKLTSDLFAKPRSASERQHVETARNQIRSGIAEHKVPRRNAFLYQHKEYFQPLLPETSYIDKLQRMYDMNSEEPTTVAYTSIDKQPAGITATMKTYQLEGLSFLVHMHQNGMSSILGDEMGLGKTLQTLSLFCWLRENEPKHGENQPFLVVCPLSVLSSWMAESKKWAPALNAVRFHGPKVERDKLKDECRVASKASKIDIVVTTYDTYAAEHSWFKRAFVWRYCVLDEGHKIKNDKSNVAHVLQGLQAEYRLLLTGTPLQNNLHEMWALLHWLCPEVFPIETSDNFKDAFDLTKGRVSTSFMDHARTLLELIMLRRMKNSPGVNLGLPPKEEILLYVPLTPMQRFWYTRILTKSDKAVLSELFECAKVKELQSRQIEADADKAQNELLQRAADELAGTNSAPAADDVWAESKEIMEKALEQEQHDTNSSTWRKLMNLVMQLRKVCSHPYLMPNAAPDPYYLGDHIKAASGKFIVLDKLISELVLKQKKKVLIFSGWTRTLDLCEDLLYLKGANSVSDASFRYLRLDGSTARARRNLGIRMFNDAKSEFKVMLISTRAGGLGINLASASDVVFMDEDWNPQITLQAEARAHRIGQTQKVTIYKIATAGTVEEQMMGRIRKKLYLSAKITESMRTNFHSVSEQGKKRKRASAAVEDDTPQLDATSLKSLIRRGAQTLSRPEVDVTEMMSWDWETTLEKCKDKPADAHVADDAAVDDETEQSWLNTMEKVECAVFEGKKHQKELEAAAKNAVDLTRADRRLNKNTTVMIDGFAINKESLGCADWEAVPTMAGKDSRLAEPVRAKNAAINNQEVCAVCWDGGDIVCCSGCPRSYHIKTCLDKATQLRAKSKMQFYCPQHECVDCQGKTGNVGGMIYRCRWCERGYCEDCLDWDTVRLVGETLPEYEMAGYGAMQNAWYIECPTCVAHWEEDEGDRIVVEREGKRIQREYEGWLRQRAIADAKESAALAVREKGVVGTGNGAKMVDLTARDGFDDDDDFPTNGTVSEVWTPLDTDVEHVSDERGGKKIMRTTMF